MEGEEGQEAPRRNQKEESEKMTVKTKTKSKGTNAKTAKYYEAKIDLLEAENEILRNAVEELKSELEKAKKTAKMIEEDYNVFVDLFSKLEKAYIKARTLVNIPDNIAGLVYELIKTRFLLWGEHIVRGEEETVEIEPDKSDLITILPPAETFRPSKSKGKK